MIPAQLAIARFRRDVTVGRLLNAVLISTVFFCILIGSAVTSAAVDVVLLGIVFVVWLTLGYHSLRGQRLAAASPSLIAAGKFDLAEDHIERALRTFSLFRTSKLLSLHHLAVLRHAQRRWGEAAELSGALLRTRLGNLRGLGRQSRLILADSLLEMGDVRGAYQAIAALYTQRLTLAEALNLLHVQLDYNWRIDAWGATLEGAATKVQLAELMSTANAARSQALMALAAKRLGRGELQAWLTRRVELLTDVRELVAHRPILAELWPEMSMTTTATPAVTTTAAGAPITNAPPDTATDPTTSPNPSDAARESDSCESTEAN